MGNKAACRLRAGGMALETTLKALQESSWSYWGNRCLRYWACASCRAVEMIIYQKSRVLSQRSKEQIYDDSPCGQLLICQH